MLFLSKEDNFLAVTFMFSVSISLEVLWLCKGRKLLSIHDLTRIFSISQCFSYSKQKCEPNVTNSVVLKTQ